MLVLLPCCCVAKASQSLRLCFVFAPCIRTK